MITGRKIDIAKNISYISCPKPIPIPGDCPESVLRGFFRGEWLVWDRSVLVVCWLEAKREGGVREEWDLGARGVSMKHKTSHSRRGYRGFCRGAVPRGGHFTQRA